MNYKDTVSKLVESGKYAFQPARDEDLEILYQRNIPSSVIEFYEAFEPQDTSSLEESSLPTIRLKSIQEAMYELTELYPGAVLEPYGFFVVASDQYGDCFLLDIKEANNGNEPPVVQASHEILCDEEITEEEARGIIIKVADTLYQFLQKVCTGELK